VVLRVWGGILMLLRLLMAWRWDDGGES
jgi:hypothetical protein